MEEYLSQLDLINSACKTGAEEWDSIVFNAQSTESPMSFPPEIMHLLYANGFKQLLQDLMGASETHGPCKCNCPSEANQKAIVQDDQTMERMYTTKRRRE